MNNKGEGKMKKFELKKMHLLNDDDDISPVFTSFKCGCTIRGTYTKLQVEVCVGHTLRELEGLIRGLLPTFKEIDRLLEVIK